MKVAIMQPGYIPWLGFFDLMKRCDKFVIYNDVKYTKNDWRNRNRIKTPQGESWLTIPVPKDSVNSQIDDVTISRNFWLGHKKTIEMGYKRAKYYNEVLSLLEESQQLMLDWSLLAKTMNAIKNIHRYLDIQCDMTYSSRVGFKRYKSTGRLILICQALGATEYLSPNGALPYLDQDLFAKAGIKLTWQDYKHPVYDQLWGDFIPNLSIIDLLFNHGKDSVNIL